jgi:integrase
MMAVYRPTYRDKKTGELKRSATWWYDFTFAGKHIVESSKSAKKTVARLAEKKRRDDLEKTYNGIEDSRQERIRTIAELADEYLKDYKLRHKSATFAEYALGHVRRLVGKTLKTDVGEKTILEYQSARLTEGAAPKSINEEIGFLLRLLDEQGDFIRAKMRRKRTLKLKTGPQVARAFSPDEKAAMLAEAKTRRSPAIYPALMLALHAGMRDAEIRGLQWARLNLGKAILTVGDSKTEAGEGRTIPLNADIHKALVDHSVWYLGKFGECRPEWYVFPFGKPQPTDPSRHVTSFKTVWGEVKKKAGVKGRWHDARHTFITDLAENPEVSDTTIESMAGHVSKQMLKHYSHIRTEAKRRAVRTLEAPRETRISVEAPKVSPKVELLN